MSKDWNGNSNSIYKTLGASNHVDEDREENDYYATEPKAVDMLLDLEKFNNNILEPCAGEGHISKVLLKNGYNVESFDLINRGFCPTADFLSDDITFFNGDVVTNPPYSKAKEFVEKSLLIIPEGNKVAMFLKIQFLESASRKKLFKENPPIRIYVTSSRLKCAKNGAFDEMGSSAVCYAWYIWQKGFKGETTLKWFN